MVAWTSVTNKLPDEGRYLVKTQCEGHRHSPIPKNYAYPCNTVNIAYFDAHKKWHYNDYERWDQSLKVTHWAPIPEVKKEEKKTE